MNGLLRSNAEALLSEYGESCYWRELAPAPGVNYPAAKGDQNKIIVSSYSERTTGTRACPQITVKNDPNHADAGKVDLFLFRLLDVVWLVQSQSTRNIELAK